MNILSALLSILLVVMPLTAVRPADPPPASEVTCVYNGDYTQILSTVTLSQEDFPLGTLIIGWNNPFAPGEGWDILQKVTTPQNYSYQSTAIESVEVSVLETGQTLASCSPAIPKLGDLSFIPGTTPCTGTVSYYVGTSSLNKPWEDAVLVVLLDSELEVSIPKRAGRTNLQITANPGRSFRAEVRVTWLGLPFKMINSGMFRMPGGGKVYLPLIVRAPQPTSTPTPTMTPPATATRTATPTPVLFPIVGDDLRGPWIDVRAPSGITITVASGFWEHIGQTLSWGTPTSFHADFIDDEGTETQWVSQSCGNAWMGVVVDIPYNGDFQLRLKTKVTASSNNPNENWVQLGFVEESAWTSVDDIPTPINADLSNTGWQTLVLDLPGLRAGRYIATAKGGAICTKSVEALFRDMTVWG